LRGGGAEEKGGSHRLVGGKPYLTIREGGVGNECLVGWEENPEGKIPWRVSSTPTARGETTLTSYPGWGGGEKSQGRKSSHSKKKKDLKRGGKWRKKGKSGNRSSCDRRQETVPSISFFRKREKPTTKLVVIRGERGEDRCQLFPEEYPAGFATTGQERKRVQLGERLRRKMSYQKESSKSGHQLTSSPSARSRGEEGGLRDYRRPGKRRKKSSGGAKS